MDTSCLNQPALHWQAQGSRLTIFLHSIGMRRRQWHPTPALLPRKSHGWRSLVGCNHGVTKSRARLSDFTFAFHFHALEKEMATHSSILAWGIPETEEPSRLPSMESHRVRHDWSDLAAAAAAAITHQILTIAEFTYCANIELYDRNKWSPWRCVVLRFCFYFNSERKKQKLTYMKNKNKYLRTLLTSSQYTSLISAVPLQT